MSKKNKVKNKGKESEKYESVRKAVVIGETFTSLLSPMTDNLPNLLIPVCGIPVLEYIVDSLFSYGIKEIILVAKNNGQELDKYIKKYHKKEKIDLIYSDDLNSIGDCLRKIQNEDLISSDFILINGLVISNIDYEKLFNVHLENKKKDKNCLMTSVLKSYKNSSNVKTDYDDAFIVYDDNTKKIYQYESMLQKKQLILNDTINIKKANSSNNYILRTDLFDSYIDVCSPEVLNMFTENFDFTSIRDSLYKTILVSEIYLDTFYLYELGKDDYCGVIRNPESYLKINLEILNRWAYPLVIENVNDFHILKINLKQISFSVYSDKENKEENYTKAALVKGVVLNKDIALDSKSKLENAILGQNVKVGKNCKLFNCIILNDVVIEDNVIIINSIISRGCKIKKGMELCYSIIGENITVNNSYKEVRVFNTNGEKEEENEEEEDDNKEEENYKNININKNDSDNNLKIVSMEEFKKNLDENEALFICSKPCIIDYENILEKKEKTKRLSSSGSKNEEEDSSHDYGRGSLGFNQRKMSGDFFIVKNIERSGLNMDSYRYDQPNSLDDEEDQLSDSDSEGGNSSEKNEEENYAEDIQNVLKDGLSKNSSIEDMIKELGGLKAAYWEKSYAETMKVCLKEIFEHFLKGQTFTSKMVKELMKLFKDWDALFKKFVPNEDTQLQLIYVLESLCSEMELISNGFHIIVQVLNSEECNIIEDDIILKWNDSKEKGKYTTAEGDVFVDEEKHLKYKKKMKKYIEENLLNDEEDEGEEEEDEK